MIDKILLVSRAIKFYPDFINLLQSLGYNNLSITALERDALYAKINDEKPKMLFMDSNFYQAATPLYVGEIVKQFPKLKIIAVAYTDYPLPVASWFVWHGAKSCLHLWADGLEEFKHGLRMINQGKDYISPAIQNVLCLFSEWPLVKERITKRQYECLVLLCNGFSADGIAREMNVTRKTIDNTLKATFDIFHVHSKEELICQAWVSELVSKNDLRFYRRDIDIKLPDWAVISQTANKELEKIYRASHGGNE